MARKLRLTARPENRPRHDPETKPTSTATRKGLPHADRAATMAAGSRALADWEIDIVGPSGAHVPDEADDDLEAWDPIEDADGHDPDHHDGDPSEPGEDGTLWDLHDKAAVPRPPAGHPEVLFIPKGSEFEVVVRRGLVQSARHAAERADLLMSLCREIAERQRAYLASQDKDDLGALTANDLATATSQDKSTVGRLIEGVTAQLPGGEVVPLQCLLGDPNMVRARFVARLLQRSESPHRSPEGTLEKAHLVPLAAIVEAVQARFGVAGNSDRNVQLVMTKAAIPPKGTKRRLAYAQGKDWWTYF